ncbi:AAA family ATPase [Gimesia aquarii]|uniref:HD domain protein n=1 Tax=Gimesia aquarii TaxID=2527964 RepID=A0A517VTZ8_9PLAN|nr:AAA family ATPase [Gimesia aquarii]QDT96484.1 HD domain protein [Gimesia aquarii]
MNWNQLSSHSLDEILDWAEAQSWCQAMAQCNQDRGWHSEGDVWTHTRMVCAQLPELEEWETLNSHEQTVLIFTALLHDAGKPLTTQIEPETGRIRSPKHAIKGEHLARAVLRDLGCNLATREEIARLVRFHGRPAFLLEKANPDQEVVSLSWLVNNRLLYLFALADTRGRTTDSMQRPEENLRLWRMVSEENQCFDQPYPFANDQARFLFYRHSEPNLHYIPHEDYSCTVTMLSGLPGSGKDTWLAKQQVDLPVVSLDDVRGELEIHPTENQGKVAQVAQKRCRDFLRAKTSFAYNATNLSRQTRQRWINLFADYGARIEIVYIEPKFEIILQQNRQRTDPVPEKVIHELARKYEPPTITEAHALVFSEG